MKSTPVCRKIITPTPFGSVGLIWSGSETAPVILRVTLSKPGLSAEEQASVLYPESFAASCPGIDRVAAGIEALLEGKDVGFSLEGAALDSCSLFQQRVLRAEHGVPRGRVSTYKLIAEHLGKPGGARAVGNALAKNPFPLIVPCHRAIRSDRRPGDYQGGLEMKRALLEMEGISFDESGRVTDRPFRFETISPRKSTLPAVSGPG